MFNQTVLQFFPAFLAVSSVLLEDFQLQQIFAVNVAQGFEVDEFFAEEQFQELPSEKRKVRIELLRNKRINLLIDGNIFQKLVLEQVVHHVDLFVIVR